MVSSTTKPFKFYSTTGNMLSTVDDLAVEIEDNCSDIWINQFRLPAAESEDF